jgi:hypothetical protein
MAETGVNLTAREARQSLFRVWLAISAVWVSFWLLIAGVAVAAVQMRNPLLGQLNAFSLIVALPPIVLLAAGVLCRFLCQALPRSAHRNERAH